MRRSAFPLPYPSSSARYLDELDRRVLVFDGAMGTSLQRLGLSAEDFGGPSLEGCHDHLVLTRPDAVRRVHESFLDGGCDVVTTCTFQATATRLAEWGLAHEAHAINVAAAGLARAAVDARTGDGRPRFVAGSLGPTGLLPSAEDPGLSAITFDELSRTYEAQARALIEGGVDLLVLETAQDILEVKAALAGFERAFDHAGKRLPVHALVTLDTSGRMLLGTDIASALTTIEALGVEAIGLNCSTGPEHMRDPVRLLAEQARIPIAVIPNAGLPLNTGDGEAVYPLEPEPMAQALADFVRQYGVRIVGGCCGTTPRHIAAIAGTLPQICTPAPRAPHAARISSAMRAVDLRQQPPPLLVGERINAQGSRRIKRHLIAGDYDAIVAVAREQAEAGAHVLDVCVALTERSDEAEQMARVVKLLSSRIDLPLMIDSTEAAVIASGLDHLPGRGIVNSINLEGGRGRLDAVVPLVRRHGAAVVALCIDERGMAVTRGHKLEVASRIHEIVTGEYGLRPEALIFDVLAFTLATGDPAWASSAPESIASIPLIKQALPGTLTALGISNVSFGLTGAARAVLNSVFLHHAVAAGLDLAIVNPAEITPYFEIPELERQLADDLLFNRRSDALQDFIAHFQQLSQAPGEAAALAPGGTVVHPDARVHQMIVHRRKEGIEAALDAAGVRENPIRVLNDVLLPAMAHVGERFGAGELILPFVLQSAEVMKKAVEHTERFLERREGAARGTIVLATVYGDVHDIGKSLVHTIVANNGYRVHDLGKQVPVNTIVDRAAELGADAIGLSALLVSTSKQMLLCVEELDRRGLAIPVLLGGAAINRRFGRRALFVEDDRPYAGGVFYCKDAFEGLRVIDGLTDPQRRDATVQGIVEEARHDRFLARPAPPPPAPAVLRSAVRSDNPVPVAPFQGVRLVEDVPLRDVLDLLDLREMYRVQWGGRGSGPGFERLVAEEFEPRLQRLKEEATRGRWLRPRAVYGYFPAAREGDAVLVYPPGTSRESGARTPIARFEFPRQERQEHLCLSDYFKDADSPAADLVALQVVTVGPDADARVRTLQAEGEYTEALYVHGLAVATAEATAEWMHRRIRRELGLGEHQGKRYSWGYPACPDLSQHQQVFALLQAKSALDLDLTTAFQIVPEHSTAAFVVHHPDAKYYTVRRVTET